MHNCDCMHTKMEINGQRKCIVMLFKCLFLVSWASRNLRIFREKRYIVDFLCNQLLESAILRLLNIAKKSFVKNGLEN